jgi:hypothetical protein
VNSADHCKRDGGHKDEGEVLGRFGPLGRIKCADPLQLTYDTTKGVHRRDEWPQG